MTTKFTFTRVKYMQTEINFTNQFLPVISGGKHLDVDRIFNTIPYQNTTLFTFGKFHQYTSNYKQ